MTTTAATTTNPNGTNADVIANLNKQASSAATNRAASSSALTSASDSSGLSGTLNMFLNMLTTQLKHQDPLSPTDSTQFTNQLVLYSQVEQGIQTNSNLTKLISLQTSNQQSASIGYIGQTVEVPGSTVPLQNGVAEFNYVLPKEASNTVVQIQDSSGATVAQLTGQTMAGTHYLSWDGKNSSGTQLSDGQYTIVVKANDVSGNSIAATSNVYGKVTGVSSDATNGTELEMGAVKTPLTSVSAIVDTTTLNKQIASKQ